MSNRPARRGMTLEERQPHYEDSAKCPRTLTKTRHIDDVLYVAGRAPVIDQTEYEIMFVTSALEEDEATTAATSVFGMRIPQPAEYLKGSTGIIKDVALRAGIDLDRCYYTACCKWLLPRAQRSKPAKKIMKWGLPILEDEIKRVKPKIIVCLGKHVFDMLSPQKISFDDAHGFWFWAEEYQAHLYVMYAPSLLVGCPEYYEMFRIDFKEVARRKEILDNGGLITGQTFTHQVINSMDELEDWLDHLETLVEEDRWPGLRDEWGNPLLSVDAEWHGKTHIDGKLRTIQFAWSETEAVVIAFRDEKTEWSFEMGEDERPALLSFELVPPDEGAPKLEGEFKFVLGEPEFDAEALGPNRNGDSYSPAVIEKMVEFANTPSMEHIIRGSRQIGKSDSVATVFKMTIDAARDKLRYAAIGKKLFATFERIKARYIGHHFPADAPWMNYWLGMETYGKLEMDTEFAMQIVDESAELGLERLGMQFTNLGRYDFDLVMWKRENKELCQGGYGFIPSSILYSYAAADVIVPYRAYPMIKRQMEAQRLWSYYRDMFGPFSSNVFVEFCMTGLPMNVEVMDQLRHLFTFAKDRLDKTFKRRMAADATRKLKSKFIKEFGVLATKACLPLIEERNGEALRAAVKQMLLDAGQLAEVPKWNKLLAHWEDSPAFNIRSSDQMARWLFDFEGLTPIKSTNQRAKGLPSMAWEKVLELPADRQSLYKPAVDKQTLAILSEQLPAIDELLNLNAVGNLSKAFLREPSVYVDEDTGEETFMERGLHSWLQHDGRIHPQTSSTETGRPRTFFPNVLNWPAVQNKRIALSVARCVQEAHEEGDLPENLLRWAGMDSDDLPTIRSCVQAPEGYVLVESDYATAEMVALAVISGDADLARILFEPDPEWALLKSKTHGASVVRVAFADAKASGVPEDARNPEFIMHVWENGTCLGKVEESDLLRDENGAVLHARYDIHWSLIERTYGKFREMMKAKIARNAAKVLNFSSAYGASENSLERKIEADTGVKPTPGTGERGLEAIRERQPRATEFLEEMAKVPKERGMYRAASGRIRHCLTHSAGSGVGWRTRNSIDSALGRELKNYPMQESVGATSARACNWLLKAYRRLGMKSRPMICLYDSVVTLAPLEERFLAARLHKICMSEINAWEYEDDRGKRTLRYSIDNEFNYRWSTRPTEADQQQLDDREWNPSSPKWNFLENHPNLLGMAGLPKAT
jgi:uracil-DNA glycosylase family 4